jgi:hypothetical protein
MHNGIRWVCWAPGERLGTRRIIIVATIDTWGSI